MMEHMHQKHPKTPLEIIKCIEMLLETLSSSPVECTALHESCIIYLKSGCHQCKHDFATSAIVD